MKRLLTKLAMIQLVLLIASTPLPAQVLVYSGGLQDGVDGVDGLRDPRGITISPDNRHLYISSSGDDAVATFSRNTSTGALTFLQILEENSPGGGTRLNAAKRLAMSPDGNHVYVATEFDDALVVFSRDVTSGLLTRVENVVDGVGGVDGLNGAYSVVVSPDNNHVYAAGSNDDMLAVFSRNTTTGALTFVEVQEDDIGGVDGLNGIRDVVLSADGQFVYAVSSLDDAISVFSRNTVSGALTFLQALRDTDAGIDGLNGAYGLYISPDDQHIYVASITDDAVTVFERNSTTGLLTIVEVNKDTSQPGGTITNLNVARNVTGDLNGEFVFALSETDNALVVFSRDASTGELTFVEDYVDGVDGVDGLDGAMNLIVSGDSREVYTIGVDDNALATFRFASVLPVELLYFRATSDDEEMGKVTLSWSTASELNNEFFSVEASPDGVGWHVLETVPGAGTTDQTSEYAVVVGHAPGVQYYRLKQTDFDGSFSYSSVESVIVSLEHNGALKVYPNPVANTLMFTGEVIGRQVALLNVMGRDVTAQVDIRTTGPLAAEIDVSRLPSGMYFLRTSEGTFPVRKL